MGPMSDCDASYEERWSDPLHKLCLVSDNGV